MCDSFARDATCVCVSFETMMYSNFKNTPHIWDFWDALGAGTTNCEVPVERLNKYINWSIRTACGFLRLYDPWTKYKNTRPQNPTPKDSIRLGELDSNTPWWSGHAGRSDYYWAQTLLDIIPANRLLQTVTLWTHGRRIDGPRYNSVFSHERDVFLDTSRDPKAKILTVCIQNAIV